METKTRSIKEIAFDIKADWVNISPYAEPYLNAMFHLRSTDDRYYMESADDIVLRFLSNASSWRGEKARAIKKELKALL